MLRDDVEQLHLLRHIDDALGLQEDLQRACVAHHVDGAQALLERFDVLVDVLLLFGDCRVLFLNGGVEAVDLRIEAVDLVLQIVHLLVERILVFLLLRLIGLQRGKL